MAICVTPVLAAGLSISPPSVEFDVPADASSQVEFLVYDFTGDLEISLEDIPLRVEPATVPVTAKEGGTKVVLTFYGDESLGSTIYEGKIRFLAMTGGTVAMGIKVRATINHIADGIAQGDGNSIPDEEAPPPEQLAPAPTPSPPAPVPTATELPIIIAGIAAATAILITLIVLLSRRRPRY
ncbi:hypothetical protein ES703_26103 [subsurface metagenome]